MCKNFFTMCDQVRGCVRHFFTMCDQARGCVRIFLLCVIKSGDM